MMFIRIILTGLLIGCTLSYDTESNTTESEQLEKVNKLLSSRTCYSSPIQRYTITMSINISNKELLIQEEHFKKADTISFLARETKLSLNGLADGKFTLHEISGVTPPYVGILYESKDNFIRSVNIVDGVKKGHGRHFKTIIGSWSHVDKSFVKDSVLPEIKILFDKLDGSY